ncbi:MAG: phage terminase large subunit [Candidatus Hydrogenedentota bacterium]|nr:MAG: phage terminase large subunit [Candidatus Hydrogenedentota bacterium]
MARLLGCDAAAVHEGMAESAQLRRSLILAPRGFGKSTLLSVVRCVFEIVRNPDVRILLASNTQAQAEAFVREVRGHLERNRIFRRVFGDFVGPKWTDRELIVSGRKRIAKEPTIYATGVGGAVVSRHFDIVICDDIVDEQNARIESRREKLRTWFFKVLLPCLEPEGKLCVVGTRYHYRDLYGHLIESGFMPTVVIIRALDSEGKSSWPERFPTERLVQIRREAGTVIFNAQYQNDTVAMKGAVFKEEWLRFYDALPLSLRTYQGVDLSIGQHSGSDFFAIVTIGTDAWGNIYVLDCYQSRLSFRQQTTAIVERFRQFDPIKVAIESNAYQAAQVERVRELGVVRAVKVFTARDKLSRAWKLSALFEDGRVWLGRNMHELIEQLLAFPQCEYDDLFDALELAIGISTFHCPQMRFF